MKETFPSASVNNSTLLKLIFPSDFEAGYSSVRAKPSAAVPSAFVTEKTNGAAKFLPLEISFGDETFCTVIPSKDFIKRSSLLS